MSDGGGCLFVVATPIGNLSDVTFRALETLRTVDLIAAEDTRHTQRLLARYEIAGRRLVSYHARNAASRGPELLARLVAGESIALVTDAGTPGISDPGADLVRAWAAAGGTVVPIAGPSAAVAAVSATGIAGPRWSFEGFLPRSGRDRRERLAALARDERGAVIFEAGKRLAATLRDLASVCGRERPAAVCRELTKLHEEIRHGTLATLVAAAASGEIDQRGEVVLVLGEHRTAAGETGAAPSAPGARGGATGGGAASASEADAPAAALTDVEALVRSGVARGEAAKRVSAATGIPRRRLYGKPEG